MSEKGPGQAGLQESSALSCAGEVYGLLEAQRDWSLDVRTKAAALVEDNPAGGIELCEQVEINDISSQNRTSVLSCCCKEQSVIQRSSPMISTVSCKRARTPDKMPASRHTSGSGAIVR